MSQVLVGSVELVPLVDAVGELGELAELFPDTTDWAPYRDLYPELFAESRWRIPCTSYLLRSGGDTVLVDTGVGPAGLWGTPACAAREAEEETGVTIGSARFVGVTNDVFEAEGKHYVTLWFEAKHEVGNAAALADDELDAVEWFPEDALPEPLFPPLLKLLAGRAVA